MNDTGWREADYRELELAERFNMVLDDNWRESFDQLFNSHYYSKLDLSELEKAAEQRWQEFTGGVK